MENMLTTLDNPYSPFDDYYAWYAWDVAKGYNTCALLSRVAIVSEEIDDGGIEAAMKEIVEYNVSGVHILVTKDSFTLLRAESLLGVTDNDELNKIL